MDSRQRTPLYENLPIWSGLIAGSAAVLLSASCCVLPLALALVGLGGAWLSFLGPFLTYRAEILVVVALILVWSWFRTFRIYRIKGAPPKGLTAALALATLALGAALTAPFWELEAAWALAAFRAETQ